MTDFFEALWACFCITFIFASCIGPIVLAAMVSPWWLVSYIITLPLAFGCMTTIIEKMY